MYVLCVCGIYLPDSRVLCGTRCSGVDCALLDSCIDVFLSEYIHRSLISVSCQYNYTNINVFQFLAVNVSSIIYCQ